MVGGAGGAGGLLVAVVRTGGGGGGAVVVRTAGFVGGALAWVLVAARVVVTAAGLTGAVVRAALVGAAEVEVAALLVGSGFDFAALRLELHPVATRTTSPTAGPNVSAVRIPRPCAQAEPSSLII